MENHARKVRVLPSAKMLPCVTICQIGCLRNLALGTSWIHLTCQLILLPQPNNLLLLVYRKICEHLKFFNEHFKLWVVVIMGLNFP